jgi:hypothetical protein
MHQLTGKLLKCRMVGGPFHGRLEFARSDIALVKVNLDTLAKTHALYLRSTPEKVTPDGCVEFHFQSPVT